MTSFTSFDPENYSSAELYQMMIGSVVPRPIALASTLNPDGTVNLSPYSYFNVFSANPPVAIFAPSRRVRNNTNKDTYHNINDIREVCINLVNYSMVNQMVITSAEFPSGVDEFVKSGLTKLDSLKIKPPRVAESPVSMECEVMEIKELGDQGGAGNLMICRVLMIHVRQDLIQMGRIDQARLDIIGRMGGGAYVHAIPEAMFETFRPSATCIGFDGLPDDIKSSNVLTGNEIACLANEDHLPAEEVINATKPKIKGIDRQNVHLEAKKLIEKGEYQEALAWLLASE